MDPAFGGATLPKGKVEFPEAPSTPSIQVELATKPDQHERGLMYRTRMAQDAGMLFVFDRSSVHTFWMHNTCIPLDMLFIDEQGVIAGVVENAPTLNDEGRSVPCPVKYVLEVNAGWVRKNGVRPGQSVKLPPS